jgi:hypothetical protein
MLQDLNRILKIYRRKFFAGALLRNGSHPFRLDFT